MSGQKSDDLGHVYGAKSPEETRKVYDDWSQSYDADNLAKGFRLPALAAGMLARHMGTGHGPILDAGCGTGLVGETLNVLNYAHVTGCDLSPQMLEAARRTGVYSALDEADMSVRLPYADDHFAGFACVGSFGPGHAPPRSLYELARVTRPGGVGVFNLLEATWRSQGFPEVMDDLTASGRWAAVETSPPFRPYMLAEPDLWSRLYVMRIR